MSDEGHAPRPLHLGRHTLRWGVRTYVVGVVNCSPDSFFGDGATSVSEAVERALRFESEGADLVDVGGESTRPGATPVALEEERRRVLPVIEALAGRLAVPLSVDTTKPQVAREALAAGAALVNDVSGLWGQDQLAAVVAEAGAGLVLMANHRQRLEAPDAPPVTDVLARTRLRWQQGLAVAAAHGMQPDKIVLDPGLGFGLRPERSLELVRRLRELRDVGHALLVGASRKGFIGHALGGLPVAERLEGSLAVVALAIAGGADAVRVHDVLSTHRARLVADAVVRA